MGFSDIRTVSSAYKRMRIFRKTSMSLSTPGNSIPTLPLFRRKLSKSFKNKEKSTGDKFSPWRTPQLHAKKGKTTTTMSMTANISMKLFHPSYNPRVIVPGRHF